MSLISKEKLLEDIEYWEQHSEPEMKDYDKRDIEQVVWSQPTVDAIPVEWIKEWLRRRPVYEDNAYDMLEDWRKENGADR